MQIYLNYLHINEFMEYLPYIQTALKTFSFRSRYHGLYTGRNFNKKEPESLDF